MTAQLDLLDSAKEARRQRDRAAGKHERELARFAPTFARLADDSLYVTLDDLHAHLVRTQALTGHETGRQLSYFGAIPRRAGLVKVGTVLSKRKRGHNEIAAWARPDRAERARAELARKVAA